MRKGILLSVLGFGLSAFLMGSATMAWFTHSTTDTPSTFASGTIQIAAAHNTWTLDIGNMAPDQTVSTVMTVTNTGTLDMKYRMYASYTPEGSDPVVIAANDKLFKALEVNVKDPSGTYIWATPKKLDQFIVTNAIARMGGLAANGGHEDLTIEITLPETAGNEVAGKRGSITFHFDATQIGNSGWSQ